MVSVSLGTCDTCDVWTTDGIALGILPNDELGVRENVLEGSKEPSKLGLLVGTRKGILEGD